MKGKRIALRELSQQEQEVLARLRASRKTEASLVQRATMISSYYEGQSKRCACGSTAFKSEDLMV